MPKVYLVSPNLSCAKMFAKRGWRITNDIHQADLVQFLGGEDVTPALYGELPHPKTYSNFERDLYELEVFELALSLGKPMCGICRGGQFLHVASGGNLWQHIKGHGIFGTHSATPTHPYDGAFHIEVSSTHHQAMRYEEGNGELLLYAKSHGLCEHVVEGEVVQVECEKSAEAIYHEDSKCLCFQPHPEFNDVDACTNYYFAAIKRLFGLGVN